jgi:hypothetical protein
MKVAKTHITLKLVDKMAGIRAASLVPGLTLRGHKSQASTFYTTLALLHWHWPQFFFLTDQEMPREEAL